VNIYAFQGKSMINALGHVRDIHGEGDVVYKPPTIGLDKKNFVAP